MAVRLKTLKISLESSKVVAKAFIMGLKNQIMSKNLLVSMHKKELTGAEEDWIP
jgi:hypothetical protein